MTAWAITVTITAEADDRDDAMALIQDLVAVSVENQSDDRFGSIVDVYSASDWSIAPAVNGTVRS